MKLIDKLAWIEVREGKILVAKSRGKSAYFIPGGKRELGESDESALLREIEEELSVKLELSSLEYYGTFQAQAHGHPLGVEVKMTCYRASYSGVIQPDSEIEDVRWVEHKDKEIVSFVDRIIFDDLRAKGLL